MDECNEQSQAELRVRWMFGEGKVARCGERIDGRQMSSKRGKTGSKRE